MFKSRVATTVAPATTPDDAMKQALLAVVQVWLDRLQQQAVVTTFFVSIDSLLFSLTSTTRSNDLSSWSKRDMVINASLGGAIIFHVCASIVAYVASFVLIRYRLNDAEKKEDDTVKGPHSRSRATSTSRNATEKRRGRKNSHSHAHRPSTSVGSTLGPSSPIEAITDFPMEMFTDLRGLVSVYRTHPLWFLRFGRRRQPQRSRDMDPEASVVDDIVATLKGMVDTLSRAHTVCAGMSSLGFVLALLGILTYAWTAVPTALGIFASACMGACAIAGVVALW
ncbi:hypothetical protein L226DRAFT_547155 [Lentinus tigrinus ALCF2SS1-7]|uniref:Transmembrane protein n=1 Tax=Lentinus tigrinus ALCF2SS1-6 TaxID=1328759 RepID=A0A5C2S2N0_9APHY|nr:hypothetical protein L227DRAFT_655261 [Lentinus tigrinus ALCF2SS1-6]RPD71939.1 hypothetical protein L226DRAFT_547155 [Lentinus tigrinus ALCF2SS1-7]